MKRFSSLALSLALSLGCLPLGGVARAATQPYSISYFDSMRVDAPVTIVLTSGKGVSARGEGDRALLDRLDLSVSGTTLIVRLRSASLGERLPPGARAVLNLSTDRLRRLIVEGSGSVRIDRMEGLSGEISLSGGGDVSVAAARLDRLTVTVGGPGVVRLAGSAMDASLQLLGTGSIDGEKLSARRVKAGNQGAGAITVTARDTAEVAAAGSGNVTILGSPTCKAAHVGTGRLICGGTEY